MEIIIMDHFELVSQYAPTGDQPQAIEELVKGFKEGNQFQTLLGVTGSGKTFTMANIIQQLNKPTLVIAHNKTLAGQLYGEFKEFFPNNAVKIRRYAKGFYIFHLVYSACFMLFLNPKGTSFGFLERLPFDIIPAQNSVHNALSSGATISFGLDNLSALMCVFTSFIMLLALIVSKSMITSKQRLFYSMMLLLGGFLTGIFAANDLFTFFIHVYI